MRSVDMRPGEVYVLHGYRKTKVTVLETPPELRARARVRVRFESGIKKGELGELPSRRVAAPWTGEDIRPTEVRRSRARLAVVDRGPRAGDLVTWVETAGLVWTLETLDEEAGLGTLTGAIFEQPMRRVVPLSTLRVHLEEPSWQRPAEVPRLGPTVSSRAELTRSADRFATTDHLRPEKPRRVLDELLDDVLFTTECVQGYARRYASNASTAAATDLLREEIRRDGFIMAGGLPGWSEYARLRVLRRFDVILNTHPTADQPARITRLYFPAASSARRQNRRNPRSRQRRAA
jgi:hypothetical protein